MTNFVTGTHVVHVKWNDKDIPGCPYKVHIGTHERVKKVRVYGPGLNSRSYNGQPRVIHIVNEEEGSGKVKVRIKGKVCFGN